MNKCKGCVRFAKRTFRKPGYHCTGQDYMIDVFPEDDACDYYWDRAEQEKKDKEYEEEQEKKRQAAWAKNKDNPPVKLPIVFDGYGYIPECPNCHEMPYSTEQCYFCGQKFIQDDDVKAYNEPNTKEGKCFSCGAPVTIDISKYNGHKSYHCDKCGCSMME